MHYILFLWMHHALLLYTLHNTLAMPNWLNARCIVHSALLFSQVLPCVRIGSQFVRIGLAWELAHTRQPPTNWLLVCGSHNTGFLCVCVAQAHTSHVTLASCVWLTQEAKSPIGLCVAQAHTSHVTHERVWATHRLLLWATHKCRGSSHRAANSWESALRHYWQHLPCVRILTHWHAALLIYICQCWHIFVTSDMYLSLLMYISHFSCVRIGSTCSCLAWETQVLVRQWCIVS